MRRRVIVGLSGLGLGALLLLIGFLTLPREVCTYGPGAPPCDAGWGGAALALVGLGLALVALSAVTLAFATPRRKA